MAMFDERRDSRGSGTPMRSRGRDELTEAPWRTGRLAEGPDARKKLVVGPDAGVLNEFAAMLLDGVKCSVSLGSEGMGSSS